MVFLGVLEWGMAALCLSRIQSSIRRKFRCRCFSASVPPQT
jgi:hypothetical protein